MAYDDQAMEGLRAPLSSGFYLRRFTGEGSLLNPVSTIEDKKDLVTFLEALNSILEGRNWLDFSFVNALDGAYLGGNVVVLKIAHGGFTKGRTSTDNTTSQQMDALIRGFQIMAHPPVRSSSSIIDLLQLMWEFDKNVLRPVLVLEFAELGTVGEYLRPGRRLNEDEKNTIIEGVADGLQVLHKSGIIHGDVKCDNVLLFRPKGGALVPKLTDFGYSILLSEVKSGSLAIVGGTEPFTAPETRWPVERPLLYSTDYFAYGMMVWQTILDGSDLFSASPFSAPAKELSDKHWRLYIQEAKESPDFVANVKVSIKSYTKSDASQNVEQLLGSLLCRDPATRSMEDAFKSWNQPMALNFRNAVASVKSPVLRVQALSNKDVLDLSRFDSVNCAIKAQIVSSLERHASNESAANVERAAQALFLLAQCHIDGFGLQQPSDEQGLENLRKAARLDHANAQEIISNVHQGIGIDFERSFSDEYGSWMTKSVNSGSRIAANSLLNYMSESGEQWQEEGRRKVEEIVSRVFLEPIAGKYGLPSIVDEESLLAYINRKDIDISHINVDGDCMLHWAAAFGLDRFVSLLIDRAPHLLDNPNILLETPLLTACCHGQKSTAEQLLNKGAKIDAISLTGETPLHWLVSFRSNEVKEMADHMPAKTLSDYLLPIGVAANRSKENQTEWFKAFQENIGHVEDGLCCPLFFSRSLLGYASDPFSRFLRLALHGENQKREIAQTIEPLLNLKLVNANSGQQLDRVSWSGKTSIMQAVMTNDTETALFLLGMEGVKPTLESSYQGGWGLKPLLVAAKNNNLRMVRALVDCGADPQAETSDGTTALQICASEFFPEQEIAKLIIEKAPDLVNRKNFQETPFATAVRNHDFDLANLLLQNGADVNTLLGPNQTNTVIFQIIAGCSPEDLLALRYLLSVPDVDFIVAPRLKYTALHAAVVLRVRYSPEGDICAPSTPNVLLEALLEKWRSREHLMMQDLRGCTALHHAAMFPDFSAIKQLVNAMEEASADFNVLTNYFGSPVYSGIFEFIERKPPESVLSRGPSAVRKWDELTEEIKVFFTKHNAKTRQEILRDKWNSLSFLERQKAQLLSNQAIEPLVHLSEYFDPWRSLGPDVKTTRERIESERNPGEIRWKRK